jgi:hypothetical protein
MTTAEAVMTDQPGPVTAAAIAPAKPWTAAAVLRSPLSVVAAALAGFLVVLALLGVRVSGGRDPALAKNTAGRAQLFSSAGKARVRTTVSGRPLVVAPGGAGGEALGAQGSVLTGSSGALSEVEADG